ncbi:MAG: SfiI family type II restriction endonuclease, partial [Spirochaetota bacterium]
MTEKDPEILSLDEIERIEKLTLRWIFQAVLDFGMEAYEIFFKSPDSVKDIAEDITRELLDRLSGFNVQ